MEIDRLKSINISLEHKIKNGGRGQSGLVNRRADGDEFSEVSSVSEKSFVNENE